MILLFMAALLKVHYMSRAGRAQEVLQLSIAAGLGQVDIFPVVCRCLGSGIAL